MKYAWIKNHDSKYPIAALCEFMKVSRSRYYQWLKSPKTKREKENEQLIEMLKELFKKGRGTYGTRRLKNRFAEQGIIISRRRIGRLMVKAGLWCKTKKKFRATTDSKHNNPGAESSYIQFRFPALRNFRSVYNRNDGNAHPVIIDNKLFFVARGKELWQSDGTTGGTKRVGNFQSGNGAPFIKTITKVNDIFFLTAKSDVVGELYYELNAINYTTNESIPIKKLPAYKYGNSFVYGGGPSLPVMGTPFVSLTHVNGTLFFIINVENGKELWMSDGSATSTTLIKEGVEARNLHNKNGLLIFSSKTEENDGIELWKSDGTTEGTVKVKGLGATAYIFSKFIGTNTLFFVVRNEDNKTQSLWRSDGTTSGTTLLKTSPDISHSLPHGQQIRDSFIGLTHVNNLLFFATSDAEKGEELWKSDGSATGTVLVKNIYPRYDEGAYLHNLTHVNGSLFFLSNNALWKSDGTEAGTTVIPFSSTTNASNLIGIKDKLFFTFSDQEHGNELRLFNTDPTVEVEPNPPSCELSPSGSTPIMAGQPASLAWNTNFASTASIDNGIGDVAILDILDIRDLYPTETTTYTMTVTGINGDTATCKATVFIEGVMPPLCHIGTDPQVITAGEGTALWWWSQNVSSATINNEKWSVTVPSDYTWFYPSETAVYTMTAIGNDGSTTTCNTTITVK